MMMLILIAVCLVLWTVVSMLCISYFNDHGAGWEEWEAFPVWMKVLILVVSPVFFISWWVR
jgi:hypothetical protein